MFAVRALPPLGWIYGASRSLCSVLGWTLCVAAKSLYEALGGGVENFWCCYLLVVETTLPSDARLSSLAHRSLAVLLTNLAFTQYHYV